MEAKRYYLGQVGSRGSHILNFCTGKKFNRDGSLFTDIRIYRNKRELARGVRELEREGYKPLWG